MSTINMIVALATVIGWATPETPAEKLQVDSVLITLIEQVEVPARAAGVLVKVLTREGQLVLENDVLAQIDDSEAQLTKNRAKIELEIARKQAENDINVRFANKSSQVTQAELKRSQESVKKYRKSISDTEIDRLRLAAERSRLEIEQSEHESETDQLTLKLKENEYQLAVRQVERRKILAPLSGVVVQVKRRRGEWVEPGETMIRILRVDRLRAEGFLKAADVREDLTGRPVTLTVNLPGKPRAQFAGTVVFVSPEINPVNGQIRVWADVENRDLLLRPGLQAEMTIDVKPARPAPVSAPRPTS